jgi:hypothetical protein
VTTLPTTWGRLDPRSQNAPWLESDYRPYLCDIEQPMTSLSFLCRMMNTIIHSTRVMPYLEQTCCAMAYRGVSDLCWAR